MLFVIDPRPYAGDAERRAQAELARAQSAQRQAQSERDRAEKLLALRALSQEEFDARTAGSEKADADVQAAQAAVDAAALDLAFTQVRAPISGRGRQGRDHRRQLRHDRGETLLTRLVSIDPVYVRFEGDEAAYLRDLRSSATRAQDARASQPVVWIGLANEDGPSARRASSCSPTTNSTRPPARSRARARLDNRDRLFTPGLFARVKLGEGASHDAVLIDDSAVGTDQTPSLRLRRQRPTTRSSTARSNSARCMKGCAWCAAGSSPARRIVVNGLQRVRPGALIAPQNGRHAAAR